MPARQYYDLFAQGGGQNARSLLLGIRLAKVFEDRDTAASYGLQLKRLYPGSPGISGIPGGKMMTRRSPKS